MDHSAQQPLGATELTEENLNGAVIYDSDGETIGTVSHLHGAGANTQVVVDVRISEHRRQVGRAVGR